MNPDALVSKMLNIADGENDPAAKKAACFQLLHQLGEKGLLTETGGENIMHGFSQIFSTLPDAAKQNLVSLAHHVSRKNNLSINMTAGRNDMLFHIMPSNRGSPQIPQHTSLPMELQMAQPPQDHMHNAVQTDLRSMIDRRDLVFEIHDMTSGARNLERGPAFFTQETSGSISVHRAPGTLSDSLVLTPDTYDKDQDPSGESAEFEQEAFYESFSESLLNRTGPGNQDNADFCHKNHQEMPIEQLKLIEAAGFKAMNTSRIPPGCEQPPLPSHRNILPASASSDEGEEIIKRLLEKMKSHGKPKNDGIRPLEKNEKAKEEPSGKKPSKKIKESDRKKKTKPKKEKKEKTKESGKKAEKSREKAKPRKKPVKKDSTKKQAKKEEKKTAKSLKKPKEKSGKTKKGTKKSKKESSPEKKTDKKSTRKLEKTGKAASKKETKKTIEKKPRKTTGRKAAAKSKTKEKPVEKEDIKKKSGEKNDTKTKKKPSKSRKKDSKAKTAKKKLIKEDSKKK